MVLVKSSMSTAAEEGCRLTALVEPGEVDLSEENQNLSRRRRLNNVHRQKALYNSSSALLEKFHVLDRYCKKKRLENGVTDGGGGVGVGDDQVHQPAGSLASNVNEKASESLQIGGPSWSQGSISLIGRRREMEDAVTVKLGILTKGSRKYDFFGVYDGHGGSRVAHACRDLMHRMVMELVVVEEEEVMNWDKIMKEGFGKMDQEVEKKGGEMATMGSTAVVAVVGEEEIIVANCGDSRAVISRAGVAVPMSNDHKPDRPDELDRIENSGGKVINWNGQRVLGVLATSRSIGDNYLKPYVIADPEVIVSKRSDGDEFLILASDGLWDVIPNEVACDVTRRCLNGQMKRRPKDANTSGQDTSLAARAASFLAELAIARGSKDNISVIVVKLNK